MTSSYSRHTETEVLFNFVSLHNSLYITSNNHLVGKDNIECAVNFIDYNIHSLIAMAWCGMTGDVKEYELVESWRGDFSSDKRLWKFRLQNVGYAIPTSLCELNHRFVYVTLMCGWGIFIVGHSIGIL